MEPTLPIGAHVAVEKAPPSVGTIVLLHPPRGAEEQICGPRPHTVRPGGAACEAPVPTEQRDLDVIKRIVAGPGDTIHIAGGHLYRKVPGASGFAREPDAYTHPCSNPRAQGCDFPTPITIPAGHWFLLGDNRGDSDDSRWWGPVPTAWIVGVITNVEAPRWKSLVEE